MAQYLIKSSGNVATAANTAKVTAVATSHASNTTSDFYSTTVYTDTFTAPSLTDAALGVGIYLTSNGQGDGTVLRATLQEDAGSGFVDTACYADFTLSGETNLVNDYIYFQTASPYTFTTTSANKYRWSIVRNSGSGSLLRARSSTTSSSTPWAFFVDTRTGTVGTGDDIIVPHGVDATLHDGLSFGSGSGSNQNRLPQYFTEKAVNILSTGTCRFDDSADTTVTIKGMVVPYRFGEFGVGSEATPYPAAYTAKLIMDMNGTAGNYGLWSEYGKIVLSGTYSTNYIVNYVSGVGTAANPLITSADIGEVGDEVLISTTENYNQTEYKFIKTKNSATSYVLSDTVGGAESALTYTHDTWAHVANLQRNVIYEPLSTTYPTYILHTGATTDGYIYVKNIRTNSIGNSGTGKFGITCGYSSGASTMQIKELSGIVSYEYKYSGLYLSCRTTTYIEHTDNIFCKSSSAQPAVTLNGYTNKTPKRWYFFGNSASSITFSQAHNVTMDDMISHGVNVNNGSNGGHIMISASAASNTFNNCNFQWARQQAMNILSVGMNGWVFNDCDFGSDGTNLIDLKIGSNSIVDAVFNSCTFGSATLITGYDTMIEGSRVGYHRYQDTDRRHRAYQPNMIVYSSGSGLSDTTADTTFDADSLALKMSPLSATADGRITFDMPQRAGTRVNFFGKLRKTSDFNGTAVVNIYLEGDDMASDSYTLSGAADTWISFAPISADYTSGTVDRIAKIEVLVNGTAGSVYLDTLFDAVKTTNPIGSMDLWKDGVPNKFLVSTVASASEIATSVWSDTSTYSAGSKGDDLAETKDNADTAANK